ncbi:hypothetical protein V8C37DRAFT_287296 [Trichoderma ceciliae]
MLLLLHSLASFCALGYNSILVHALPTASSAIPGDPDLSRHAIVSRMRSVARSFFNKHTPLCLSCPLYGVCATLRAQTVNTSCIHPFCSRILVALPLREEVYDCTR